MGFVKKIDYDGLVEVEFINRIVVLCSEDMLEDFRVEEIKAEEDLSHELDAIKYMLGMELDYGRT